MVVENVRGTNCRRPGLYFRPRSKIVFSREPIRTVFSSRLLHHRHKGDEKKRKESSRKSLTIIWRIRQNVYLFIVPKIRTIYFSAPRGRKKFTFQNWTFGVDVTKKKTRWLIHTILRKTRGLGRIRSANKFVRTCYFLRWYFQHDVLHYVTPIIWNVLPVVQIWHCIRNR